MKFTLALIIIGSCLLSCSPQLAKRTIRIQTGTSTWTADENVFSDSGVDYVIKFDSAGKLLEEIKIFRDFDGNKIDSVHSTYDSDANVIRYHTSNANSTYHIEYDSLNTQIKISIINGSDTIIQSSAPIYTEVTDSSKSFIKVYDNSRSIALVRFNRQKQPIYWETKYEREGEIVNTEILIWKRNKLGNVLEYIKKTNDEIAKSTKSIFKNGLEVKRIEKYFNPNYIVTTTYEYGFY